MEQEKTQQEYLTEIMLLKEEEKTAKKKKDKLQQEFLDLYEWFTEENIWWVSFTKSSKKSYSLIWKEKEILWVVKLKHPNVIDEKINKTKLYEEWWSEFVTRKISEFIVVKAPK